MIMLDLRKRIFIIISLTVGLILALLLGYLFLSPAGLMESGKQILKSVSIKPSTSDLEEFGSAQTQTTSVEVFVMPEFSQEIYAKQVARLFVERFASYSNQNDNAHLSDALVLATKKMSLWLEKQKIEASQNYEGVTTRVLVSEIVELTATEAVVSVATQQEIKKDNKIEIKQRSGRVELVMVGDDWRVNGFFWD